MKTKATKSKKSAVTPAEGEKQLSEFIAKFEPEMAARIRAVRAALRKRLPTAIEIVYDNYNFFVIGYSSTERPSDCILSLAANSKGVGLSFYYGSTLPDPARILQRRRPPESIRAPRGSRGPGQARDRCADRRGS